MLKFKLNKFKAFHDEVSITLDGKNLLLYGENGSGKSSLYEAIKTVFFNRRMEAAISASTPDEREQMVKDFWIKYNNKITNQDFSIEINDSDYKFLDTSNYQIFMISRSELDIEEGIYLKNLVSKFFFTIESIDDICSICDIFQGEVNKILTEFNESVSIEIDEEDDFAIKIIDSRKYIESKSEIKKFFNEAKLNLIIILILLNVVFIKKENSKKKILVLDDFITSLDSSNRIFLIRYILDKFNDTQILIFTHNISFYNLSMFMINNFASTVNGWSFANLYEINNMHRIYQKSEIEDVNSIRNDFNAIATSTSGGENIVMIGNRIRKKFEILLYEHSKLLMIGAVEDSNKIIDRIMKGNAVYYSAGKTASDLIDSIQRILSLSDGTNLANILQNRINDYKNHDFINFQKIVKELKLYQKVTMHPMSHGSAGMPTFTIAEMKKSIELLEKMEDYLRRMVDGNVSSI